MDRADGSLFDALSHEGFAGTDWDKITHIGRRVAECVHHLHDNGVVHGDIKPLHILRMGHA